MTTTATSDWPRPLELGLRLIVIYALLFWLAHRYGRDFIQVMMPLFRALIASLDEHERVLSIILWSDGADTVVRMNVMLPHAIQVRGEWLAPTSYTFFSTIGTGLILQPGIVAFGLVLAWPVQRIAEYPLRIAPTRRKSLWDGRHYGDEGCK